MNRVILTPAAVPSPALAELKQWLGITTAVDDAPLAALIAAATETCEGFTGALPVEAECEEVLAPASGWRRLATRPVLAIIAVEALAGDGSRTPLPPGAWDSDLDAEGGGHVRIAPTAAAGRVAVRFTAGLAPAWDALPMALRHGIVRLAAHQHREREGAGAAPLPPASVAALWRPWRRMRLA
ncbi:head-tail connector protein [Novosphingobium soli]|uniref:Phage gp6-like head-tail connector protein n=1 Tax=Novosphingobium soli TaxID=574956 RepID=A0ABV6CRZ8_9SPHN